MNGTDARGLSVSRGSRRQSPSKLTRREPANPSSPADSETLGARLRLGDGRQDGQRPLPGVSGQVPAVGR